ncbi:MAG: ankyrin repeat domain-containing protein [Rickettsiaceae bacterium H1]|nr:ankyrin repeat domain-containing protein [Rickettsiaceae bacterium H1]
MENVLVVAIKRNEISLKQFKDLIRDETDKGKKIEALFKAADEGHKEFVEALIDAGVDVDAQDEFNWTVLMYAEGKGIVDIAKLLIDLGANVNAKD